MGIKMKMSKIIYVCETIKEKRKKITSWIVYILFMPYYIFEIWWVFHVCNTFQFRLIMFLFNNCRI